jgi:hypothetical protein
MWDFYNKHTVKAAKEHRCAECLKTISKGERHLYCAGKVEGDFNSYRLCTECDLIAVEWCQAYDEGEGWPLGDLRMWLRDEGVEDALAWAVAQKAHRMAARTVGGSASPQTG